MTIGKSVYAFEVVGKKLCKETIFKVSMCREKNPFIRQIIFVAFFSLLIWDFFFPSVNFKPCYLISVWIDKLSGCGSV